MPVEFQLDEPDRIVRTRAWGCLTDDDLLDHQVHVTALFRDEVLDSTWAQIYDTTGAENLDGVTTRGLERLAQGLPWPDGSLMVIVTSGVLQFGLARMFELASDFAGARILPSVAEAEAFIARARARSGEAT
jgi:hypothetical protein